MIKNTEMQTKKHCNRKKDIDMSTEKKIRDSAREYTKTEHAKQLASKNRDQKIKEKTKIR